jgi:hypothetical protein
MACYGTIQCLAVEAVSGETLAWMLTYAGSVVLVTVNLRNELAKGRIRLPAIVRAGHSIRLCDLYSTVSCVRTQEEWASIGCVFKTPPLGAAIWVDAATHHQLSTLD